MGTGRLMRRRADCGEMEQGGGNTHPLGEFPTHVLAGTLTLVGTDIWDRRMGPTYGADVWGRRMGPTYGTDVWDRRMGPTYGTDVCIVEDRAKVCECVC